MNNRNFRLITFVLLISQLYVYFAAFQSVDEEEFGGVWELTKEGFMTRQVGNISYFRSNSII